jgi:hypothetical protein
MMSRQLVYDGAVFLQSVVVMKAGDQFWDIGKKHVHPNIL